MVMDRRHVGLSVNGFIGLSRACMYAYYVLYTLVFAANYTPDMINACAVNYCEVYSWRFKLYTKPFTNPSHAAVPLRGSCILRAIWEKRSSSHTEVGV